MIGQSITAAEARVLRADAARARARAQHADEDLVANKAAA